MANHPYLDFCTEVESAKEYLKDSLACLENDYRHDDGSFETLYAPHYDTASDWLNKALVVLENMPEELKALIEKDANDEARQDAQYDAMLY